LRLGNEKGKSGNELQGSRSRGESELWHGKACACRSTMQNTLFFLQLLRSFYKNNRANTAKVVW
jgi:hypothetical protein